MGWKERDDRLCAFRVYCTSQGRLIANKRQIIEMANKSRDVLNMHDQRRIEIYISGNGGIQ
ncbi:unnamed protein product [Paramecium octaurelia]|uniref:Uncharacterized protein n=1 Tax=Paramecium octaurelia TaxID=43137 RepID=A0A8S1WSK2_PAROT|nr:unnamed protein product [Paramecium octaurelia]